MKLSRATCIHITWWSGQ